MTDLLEGLMIRLHELHHTGTRPIAVVCGPYAFDGLQASPSFISYGQHIIDKKIYDVPIWVNHVRPQMPVTIFTDRKAFAEAME